jgi:IclR family transcriptional regulator, pca regulon regulatory protein
VTETRSVINDRPDARPTSPNGSSAPDEESQSSTYVTAFGRGLAVIRCFSESSPTLSIADVAKATGLNRSTARRFLHTLEAHGYVGCERGRYSLRPRILELGYSYLSSISVDEILQQELLRLAERLHESCSAGVLDGHDVVFVARAQTSYPRVMTLALTVGTRIPAYLTALGRVLLADLPEDQLDEYLRTAELHKQTQNTVSDPEQLRKQILGVRAKGYCIMDQEIEMGVRAAAVPVRRTNKPTIAISVASHASQQSVSAIESKFVPPLQETAAELDRLFRLQN